MNDHGVQDYTYWITPSDVQQVMTLTGSSQDQAVALFKKAFRSVKLMRPTILTDQQVRAIERECGRRTVKLRRLTK